MSASELVPTNLTPQTCRRLNFRLRIGLRLPILPMADPLRFHEQDQPSNLTNVPLPPDPPMRPDAAFLAGAGPVEAPNPSNALTG